ncbi:MAG TPA: iron ABC transporter substrate-binding protein [Synergistaceae bacterium]|nr:iron ABC transporter substrate-binding protein [Synergistaceae bacterium]
MFFRKRTMLSLVVLLSFLASSCFGAEITVTDCLGRAVDVPQPLDHVIISGSGGLRLLTYLQALDRVVAADSGEERSSIINARPYTIAHPELKKLPVFGEFRGRDNPELIAGLSPLPQVIFKVSPLSGPSPDDLTAKTGIPVVGLEYGNLTNEKEKLYATLRLLGSLLGKADRAEEVVAFFEHHLAELVRRTAEVPEEQRPTCYLGGVAYRGPHGLTSTEPGYPPFFYTGARNIAADLATGKSENVHISREKLLEWDPQVIFVDLSTLVAGEEANALFQLCNDPVFQALGAVNRGALYGVLPYNSYNTNFGSLLADGYFVGKVLYPEQFADVDPEEMADRIYTFLVGKPVFPLMNEAFSKMVFRSISPEE